MELRLKTLEDENGQLRELLRKAQVTIQRLHDRCATRQQQRLTAHSSVPPDDTPSLVGDDDVALSKKDAAGGLVAHTENRVAFLSCAMAKLLLYNTQGTLLCGIYLDVPESDAEFHLWLSTYLPSSVFNTSKVLWKSSDSGEWYELNARLVAEILADGVSDISARLVSLDLGTRLLLSDHLVQTDDLVSINAGGSVIDKVFCDPHITIHMLSFLTWEPDVDHVCTAFPAVSQTLLAHAYAFGAARCRASACVSIDDVVVLSDTFMPIRSGSGTSVEDACCVVHGWLWEQPELPLPMPAAAILNLARVAEAFNEGTVKAALRPYVRSMKRQAEDAERKRTEGALPRETTVADSDVVPGRMFDVLDTVNKWFDATVLDVEYSATASDTSAAPSCPPPPLVVRDDSEAPAIRRVLVHYNKWTNNWDEWIDWSSSKERRFAPLGTKFDTSKDRLRSDFAFFLLFHVDDEASLSAPREARCGARAFDVAARASDGLWTAVIKRAFRDNGHLLECLEGARCIVREAHPHSMATMIETSYVDPIKIQSLFLNMHDTGRLVCRLVELYTETTSNAFFIAVNTYGEGLVYTRYGARQWKH